MDFQMGKRLQRMLLEVLKSFSAVSWLAVGAVVPPLSVVYDERAGGERPSTRPLTPAEREIQADLEEIDW